MLSGIPGTVSCSCCWLPLTCWCHHLVLVVPCVTLLSQFCATPGWRHVYTTFHHQQCGEHFRVWQSTGDTEWRQSYTGHLCVRLSCPNNYYFCMTQHFPGTRGAKHVNIAKNLYSLDKWLQLLKMMI